MRKKLVLHVYGGLLTILGINSCIYMDGIMGGSNLSCENFWERTFLGC